MIDSTFMLLVLIFSLFGIKSGALKQVCKWAAMILAFIISHPLSSALAPSLAPSLEMPPAAVKMVGGALGFYFLYIVFNFIAYWNLRSALGDVEDTGLNRIGGFALGGLKGAVILSIPLAIVLFFEQPLTEYVGALPVMFRQSVVVAIIRKHNPIAAIPIPAVAKRQALAEAAKHPPSAEALAADPTLAGILNDPAVKAALGDDSMVKALQDGDWPTLQKDPRVASLLSNPQIASMMQGVMDLDKEPQDSPDPAASPTPQ